jgi:hypothetical protein
MTHTRESIVFFSNRFGQNQIIKYGDGMKRTRVRRTLGTESTARDVEIKLCIILPYFSALVRDTHLIYLPFLRQSCVSRIMGPAQVDSTVVIVTKAAGIVSVAGMAIATRAPLIALVWEVDGVILRTVHGGVRCSDWIPLWLVYFVPCGLYIWSDESGWVMYIRSMKYWRCFK